MNGSLYVNFDKEEYLELTSFNNDINEDSAVSKTLEYFLATEWANDKIAVVFENTENNLFPGEENAYKYIIDNFSERNTLNSAPAYKFIVNTSKREYYLKAALPFDEENVSLSPLPFIACEPNANQFEDNKLSEKEEHDIGRWFCDSIIATNDDTYCNGFALYESPYIKEKQQPKSLSGLNFVVTGTVSGFTRYEMESLIAQHGGKCQKTVSKNTDFLVRAYKPGTSKIAKAAQYGTKVISEEEFFEMIGER